jgi:hypothetical protein
MPPGSFLIGVAGLSTYSPPAINGRPVSIDPDARLPLRVERPLRDPAGS